MPYFTDDFVEEVRTQNDIVDVISGYVSLTKRGSSYYGLCPFHTEKTPSFHVEPAKQMYYCFGCGAGGNTITFLMEYENFSFPEAVEHLADRAGIPLPAQEYSAERKRAEDRKTTLYQIQKDAANYFYVQRRERYGEAAQRYLKNRQLTDQTIRSFALGYALPYRDDLYRYLKQKGYSDALLQESGLVKFDDAKGPHDRFWNRVMFPIQDASGHVIGFGGRVLGDGLPKYVNSPETEIFDKSRNLYAMQIARRTREDSFILCEGYMDVISLHQAGFTNAVASLGTSLTAGHAKLLKRYQKKEVLLCYDSDAAGVKAALRAIPILKAEGLHPRVLSMAPYKDPDELIKDAGSEAFREKMREAQDGFLFTMDQLLKQYDQSDPRQRTLFQQETARQLSRIPDEFERNNYLEECVRRYGIPQESLKKRVNRLGLEGGILPEEPRSTAVRRTQKDPAGTSAKHAASQRILLSYLCMYPEDYEAVRGYVSPEDFEGDVYREAARLLYEQLENGQADPAAILDRYPEPEKQKEIAAVFGSRELIGMDETHRTKTVIEAICKIKQRSLEQQSSQGGQDASSVMRMISERRALEELTKKGEL